MHRNPGKPRNRPLNCEIRCEETIAYAGDPARQLKIADLPFLVTRYLSPNFCPMVWISTDNNNLLSILYSIANTTVDKQCLYEGRKIGIGVHLAMPHEAYSRAHQLNWWLADASFHSPIRCHSIYER
jgi:hypothetical protein